MAEVQSEEDPDDGAARHAEDEAAAAAPVQPKRRSRSPAPWLATLLILVIAGVASAPFWAPAVVALLPWGVGEDGAAERSAALAARVAAIEQRPAAPAVDVDAIKSAQNALAHRVDQLETAVNARFAELEKRQAEPVGDDTAMKSALSALTKRLDRVEAAGGDADRRVESAITAEKAGLQQVDQRLAVLEAQSASLKADDASAVQNIQQELSRLAADRAELATRLTAVEREAQSHSIVRLRTDAMLALLLAQMREAVEQARPFPAEYDAFTMLAHDPELLAAAKPLAEAARNGLASRAVLAKGLAELSRQPATAGEPATEPDWSARALASLRGLVTIRRIDGGAQTGPQAAVSAAQAALARDDLAGAVAALDPVTGEQAEAVRPWLRMARERLAVEAALDRVQELLTARLANPPAEEPAAAPVKAPEQGPEKPKAPS